MLDESPSLPILFASHDGHTAKIVERLALRLWTLGVKPDLVNLARDKADLGSLHNAPLLLIAAPIRFGYHLPPVENFVRTQSAWLRCQPLAVISINLTGRKPNKNTPDTNPYLRKWLKRHKLSPALAAVFGGRLEYKIYRWWEKRMIQLIMKITGGPTHLDAVVDYTDWDKVDSFAHELAALCHKNLKDQKKDKAA